MDQKTTVKVIGIKSKIDPDIEFPLREILIAKSYESERLIRQMQERMDTESRSYFFLMGKLKATEEIISLIEEVTNATRTK